MVDTKIRYLKHEKHAIHSCCLTKIKNVCLLLLFSHFTSGCFRNFGGVFFICLFVCWIFLC